MTSKRFPAASRGLRQPKSLQDSRGSALFLVLILGVVLTTVIGATFAYVSTVQKDERRSNVRNESIYAAEYAFEVAYQQLNTLINQNTVNLPSVAQTSGSTNRATAPVSVFTSAAGYNWDAFITVPVQDGVPVDTHTGFNASQGTYKFMTIVELSRTTGKNAPPVHMEFHREWVYSLRPLFQYAIFYNGDMELFPGADFIVNGRVHSNGRIYTGTTASITFSDYVTDVNGVSNKYNKPADPRTQGALNGKITYSKDTPVVSSRQSPPGDVSANTSDDNHNNDGPRELIEVPVTAQSDDNSTERLYNKAGLKILVNTTASDKAIDNGVTVPAKSRMFLTADGTVIPSSDPMATYLAGLVSSGTFHDYREKSDFTTTDVDVSKINDAYNAGGLPQTIPNANKWPNDTTVPAALKNTAIPSSLRGKKLWNGVLYVSDVTNSASSRKGVKLVNGTKLPDGNVTSSPTKGLTIVTSNAAFVVGDYNTGGVPPVDGDKAKVTDANCVSGYTVQPAAVIADAVTVVSSNWTSGKYDSQSSLSKRPAANTTVNSALISGIVASDGTAYSGGVENYIRLLEDWDGRRLTYYGSMVNVYQSQESTEHWLTTGNYYNAPTRNWYFDVNFLDPNKLPPGTPIVRSLMRGQWAQVK